jgi:hypothetical protein
MMVSAVSESPSSLSTTAPGWGHGGLGPLLHLGYKWRTSQLHLSSQMLWHFVRPDRNFLYGFWDKTNSRCNKTSENLTFVCLKKQGLMIKLHLSRSQILKLRM